MSFSKSETYIKVLLPIFRLYQLSGFSPFSMPPFSRSFLAESRAKIQKDNYKWAVYAKLLCCGLLISAVTSMFTDTTHVVDKASRMLNYMGFLMVMSVRLLAAMVVVESLFGKSEQIQFLSILDSVDRMLQQRAGHMVDQMKTRSTTVTWLIFWIIKIIALQIFIVHSSHALQQKGAIKWLWLLYVFPMALSSIRFYQLIHYVELIGLRFIALNEHLNNICGTVKRMNASTTFTIQLSQMGGQKDRKVAEEIILLRVIYNQLWEANASMNSSFRWTLLLSIGSSFVIIVVNLYRSLVFLLTTSSQNTLDDVIMFTIWSMYHILYLMKISKACAETIDQVIFFSFCFFFYLASQNGTFQLFSIYRLEVFRPICIILHLKQWMIELMTWYCRFVYYSLFSYNFMLFID